MKPFALLPAILLACSAFLPNCVFAGSAAWNLDPTSNDWNTAVNWMPTTVPNGPGDIATFSTSNRSDLSVSNDIEVSEIDFGSGASSFTITTAPTVVLTISGAGIVNNSGTTQSFVTQTDLGGSNSIIAFTNDAAAGGETVLTAAGGGEDSSTGGIIHFEDRSSADHASFEIFDGREEYYYGGEVYIDANATAANATFVVYGGYGDGFAGYLSITGNAANAQITNDGGDTALIHASGGKARIVNKNGGHTDLVHSGSAVYATILNQGGSFSGDFGGGTIFSDNSSADNAVITSNGGHGQGATGGYTTFYGDSSADSAVITSNGGHGEGATGGTTTFWGYEGSPTAGNATLIANAGIGGGEGGRIVFDDGGDGGTARFQLFGNGSLDVSLHPSPGVTTGSVEGDGLIFLGAQNLTLGNNDLNTTFSGVIQGDGDGGGTGSSLTKIGSGRLNLAGSNTYTGGTTVESGTLLANNASGSATGFGNVFVTAGTFGGAGTVAGRLTVGTGSGSGAFLAPGNSGVKPGSLTIQKRLILEADATYKVTFDSRIPAADKVSSLGASIRNASILFNDIGASVIPAGTVFTLIENTAAIPIVGAFSNLADGSTITIGSNTFQANYEGGDGNDLTLTVVP
jgi:autotransporter-associated beta strand protein